MLVTVILLRSGELYEAFHTWLLVYNVYSAVVYDSTFNIQYSALGTFDVLVQVIGGVLRWCQHDDSALNARDDQCY